MTDQGLLVVCTSCFHIHPVGAGDDLWDEITETIAQHRQQRPQCSTAKFWTGTRLEDCPDLAHHDVPKDRVN